MEINSKLHPLLTSELEVTEIMSSTAYLRLKSKTQVHFPKLGSSEVVHDRLSHTNEVAPSASIISLSIAARMGWEQLSVDYRGSIKPAALLHDTGHPPLGHDGAKFLDAYFKDAGLEEGFSDNNNTLVVIKKNKIAVSDYTIASVIKYPDKLYPSQKGEYEPILEAALKDDFEHFKSLGVNLKNQTRTIACQVMDLADENTYVCSDLSDFFCLGNTIPEKDIIERAEKHPFFTDAYYSELIDVIKCGDKNVIRGYFNNIKNKMNTNYEINENGVVALDPELKTFWNLLWELELSYYISSVRKSEFHLSNMKKLRDYISNVVHYNLLPSKSYSKLIEECGDPVKSLMYKRDMIAETTDWFVTGFDNNETWSNFGVGAEGLDIGPESTIHYD